MHRRNRNAQQMVRASFCVMPSYTTIAVLPMLREGLQPPSDAADEPHQRQYVLPLCQKHSVGLNRTLKSRHEPV